MWHTYARCTQIAKIGLFQVWRLCNTKLKETLRVKLEVYRVSYGSQTLISVQENKRRERWKVVWMRAYCCSSVETAIPVFLLSISYSCCYDVIFRERISPIFTFKEAFLPELKRCDDIELFSFRTFSSLFFTATTHLTIKHKLNISYRCVFVVTKPTNTNYAN